VSEVLGWPRLMAAGCRFQLKTMTQSSFFVLIAVIQPVIFASIAFYLLGAGGRERLLYAGLGAGLMGVWSTTLFGSGGFINWERIQGTLESLVVTPAPLLVVLLGPILATALFGMYAVVATLAWGRLVFGMPLVLAHPLLFPLALVGTVLSLGLLGLVMASTFILYRHANALSNLLEYPVWLVSGLLVPLSMLPGWTHPLAWVLAPTWGVAAIRASVIGGEPWGPIAACFGLAAAYMVLAWVALRHFERLARAEATLALS